MKPSTIFSFYIDFLRKCYFNEKPLRLDFLLQVFLTANNQSDRDWTVLIYASQGINF